MKKKSMIRLLTNKITVIGYWLLVIGYLPLAVKHKKCNA